MRRIKPSVIVTTCVLALMLSMVSVWSALAEQQDASIKQSIRRALEGQPAQAGSEEPLLQDVLDIIQDQGSILDGSALDVQVANSATPNAPNALEDQYARTAESLLKAARMLSRLPGGAEADQIDLIRRMRKQAQHCLAHQQGAHGGEDPH